MELNELIDSIESIYSEEQQKEILEYFWKAEKESHIPDSPLLFDLINKGFLKISEKSIIPTVPAICSSSDHWKMKFLKK